MFRQIWAGVFLLMISTIFLFSTFALGQVSEEDQVVEVGPVLGRAIATGDYRPRALPVFADIEVEGLTTRATELLDDVEEAVNNLKPDDPKTDRPKELGKLRTFRQEVIRVTPLLRAYTDSLRLNRSTIQVYRNTISTDAEERILSRIVDWKSQLEQARSMLDEIVKQKSVPSSNTQDIDKRILEARGEINFLDRRVANTDAQIKPAKERDIRAKDEIDKVKEDIAKFSTAIKDADNIINGLDSFLGRIDDLTGDLLRTETQSSGYTNTSTIIFSILVGGVIVGFFGIAFISEKVRDAIFSGESGIQFVTLFSLVIAIILFGVLKILEGKELSALLGGLSGYILGRGSNQISPSRHGETIAGTVPPPASNITPQPGN